MYAALEDRQKNYKRGIIEDNFIRGLMCQTIKLFSGLTDKIYTFLLIYFLGDF